MTIAMYFAAACALIAVVVLIGAPYVERGLMYAPDPTRSAPSEAGLHGVSEVVLDTPDGHRIVSWHAPAAKGQPTLLYVHGNAGTLADRAERIAAYRALGRGVFIMSYRGYSGSTGSPSERANVADAKLAYDWLRSRGIAGEDIFLYGESIGTGIVVQVAAAREVGGLVLDAPYTSIVDIAERFYPYLPARLMMRDRYETLRHLGRVSAPILVVHGERDTIIPVEMGREIARQATSPAEIVTFREAGHSDHYRYGSFEAINAWIDRVRQARAERLPTRAAG